MTITRDDWLKALGEAVKPVDPEALTVRELAEMTGISRRAMDEHVRRLVDAGKAIRAYKVVQNSAGQQRHVAAYRLVP